MSQFWDNVEAGMSIPDAVEDLLARIRSERAVPAGTPWFRRPGIMGGHCGRGFNFHAMGLQHGPDSKFAKNLRDKSK